MPRDYRKDLGLNSILGIDDSTPINQTITDDLDKLFSKYQDAKYNDIIQTIKYGIPGFDTITNLESLINSKNWFDKLKTMVTNADKYLQRKATHSVTTGKKPEPTVEPDGIVNIRRELESWNLNNTEKLIEYISKQFQNEPEITSGSNNDFIDALRQNKDKIEKTKFPYRYIQNIAKSKTGISSTVEHTPEQTVGSSVSADIQTEPAKTTSSIENPVKQPESIKSKEDTSSTKTTEDICQEIRQENLEKTKDIYKPATKWAYNMISDWSTNPTELRDQITQFNEILDRIYEHHRELTDAEIEKFINGYVMIFIDEPRTLSSFIDAIKYNVPEQTVEQSVSTGIQAEPIEPPAAQVPEASVEQHEEAKPAVKSKTRKKQLTPDEIRQKNLDNVNDVYKPATELAYQYISDWPIKTLELNQQIQGLNNILTSLYTATKQAKPELTDDAIKDVITHEVSNILNTQMSLNEFIDKMTQVIDNITNSPVGTPTEEQAPTEPGSSETGEPIATASSEPPEETYRPVDLSLEDNLDDDYSLDDADDEIEPVALRPDIENRLQNAFDSFNQYALQSEQAEMARSIAQSLVANPSGHERLVNDLLNFNGSNMEPIIRVLDLANERLGHRSRFSPDRRSPDLGEPLSQERPRPSLRTRLTIPEGFNTEANPEIWNRTIIHDFGFPFINFTNPTVAGWIRNDPNAMKKMDSELSDTPLRTKTIFGKVWDSVGKKTGRQMLKSLLLSKYVPVTLNAAIVTSNALLNSTEGSIVGLQPVDLDRKKPKVMKAQKVSYGFVQQFYNIVDFGQAMSLYVKISKSKDAQDFLDKVDANNGIPPFYILFQKTKPAVKFSMSESDNMTGTFSKILSAIGMRETCVMVKAQVTMPSGKNMQGGFIIPKHIAENLFK